MTVDTARTLMTTVRLRLPIMIVLPAVRCHAVEGSSDSDIRFYKPGDPLPPGGVEALNGQSVQEHQDAIDRALRRK